MLLKICQSRKSDDIDKNSSKGVFQPEFRNQLVTTISVTIIALCHGINIGWLSPTLPKLQSPSETPLSFVINVEEGSWVGSILSIGAVAGNFVFAQLLDRVGRKACIYGLALPTLILWLMIYFASSIEYLYIARFFGGTVGGGVYVVLPLFISEIADSTIRGRLSSLFVLSLNTGILLGYILTSRLSYHLVPYIVLIFPLLYLLLAFRYPETPQHLLRYGRDEDAKESFKFYKNFKSTSKNDLLQIEAEFMDFRTAVVQQMSENGAGRLKDFYNKRAIKSLFNGIILMALCLFCGGFAIVNYMSTIFTATKSQIDPNTNTIIIGSIQIFGAYVPTLLVDRFGRKILLILSTGGMGLGLAVFGIYAFYIEDSMEDPSTSSYGWLVPLLLMALIVFLYNIGLSSVTFVVIVEIMPPRIRSRAVSLSLCLLAVFAFISLKIFPIFMDIFGLAATMWFCATVCAFGLFYIPIFLKETKGKSMVKDVDGAAVSDDVAATPSSDK